jgi:hypothetical protein
MTSPIPTADCRAKREPLPLLFATLPVCRSCGGTKFRTRKHQVQSDLSKTAYAICKACGAKAKIVWEKSDL